MKEVALMTRIDKVNPEEVDDDYIRKVLQAQAKTWGAPLLSHLVYARRPSIFHGVRAMLKGIATSGLIDETLQALINRRVASLNGCEFCQDINAAMGSRLGLSDEKILALADYATSPHYSEVERVTLEYADTMTITRREVSDAFFARLRQFYDEDALVELTQIIAWENALSKFNRALRVPSQQLWKRQDDAGAAEEGEKKSLGEP
jgi:AhpD family alkylhydroperoxidase